MFNVARGLAAALMVVAFWAAEASAAWDCKPGGRCRYVPDRQLVCPPGTGLDCKPWHRDPKYVTPGNRCTTPGIAAAAALVDIVAAVVMLVDSSAPSADVEREVIQARERGEEVDPCRLAEAWAASGARALKSGDVTSAEAHFAAASMYARTGHCGEAATTGQHDRDLAAAVKELEDAIGSISCGRDWEANNSLFRAAEKARTGKAADLSQRIRVYRSALLAKRDSTPGQSRAPAPKGSVDCGNGYYCPQGNKCAPNQKCAPAKAVDCGNGRFCPQGTACLLDGACGVRPKPDQAVPGFFRSGSGWCANGQRASSTGGCVNPDQVDCGDGTTCPLGATCNNAAGKCEGGPPATGPYCGDGRCQAGYLCSSTGPPCYNPALQKDCGNGTICRLDDRIACTARGGCALIIRHLPPVALRAALPGVVPARRP